MARYVTRIETDMTPEDAFDFMADMRNFEQWDPGVSSAEQVEGDGPAEGAVYELEASGTTLRYVLEEYDRPNRFVAEANTGRLRSYDVIEVEASDGGSIVTYDATLELKGLFKVAEPIMKLAFQRIGSKADEGMQQALDGRKVG